MQYSGTVHFELSLTNLVKNLEFFQTVFFLSFTDCEYGTKYRNQNMSNLLTRFTASDLSDSAAILLQTWDCILVPKCKTQNSGILCYLPC